MQTKKKIAIIGAGGFAREVRWLLNEINQVMNLYEFVGYIVSDLNKLGDLDSKENVLGDFSWIEKSHNKIDCLASGIGTPASKLKVVDTLKKQFPDLEWPALIHPTVRFDHSSCAVAEGVILCAGIVGTVNITFSAFSMVNLNCTLGHESTLGRGCVLNPTVNISGGVNIGEGVLVGTGAQILQYLKIGAHSVVGAGAVVTKDVEAGTTVVGVPAKPLVKGS